MKNTAHCSSTRFTKPHDPWGHIYPREEFCKKIEARITSTPQFTVGTLHLKEPFFR